MSKVDRLLDKPAVRMIGGVEWEIPPLGIEDIELVLDMTDVKSQVAAVKKIVYMVIKHNEPGVTDEQIGKIGIKYFKEFRDAIEETNGLKVEDVESKEENPKSEEQIKT